MEWEDEKQVQLNTELKELRDRIKSGKETEGSLILIQMQIKAKEKELLESRMEHAKQWQEMVDDEYRNKGEGIKIQKEAQNRLREFNTELFETHEEIEKLTKAGTIDDKGFGGFGMDTNRENLMQDLRGNLMDLTFMHGDVAGRQALDLLEKYGIIDDGMNIVDPRLLTDHVYRKDVFEALNNVIQESINKDEEWRTGSGAGAKAFRESMKNLRGVQSDVLINDAANTNRSEKLVSTIDLEKTLSKNLWTGENGPAGGSGVFSAPLTAVDNSSHQTDNTSIQNFISHTSNFATDRWSPAV